MSSSKCFFADGQLEGGAEEDEDGREVELALLHDQVAGGEHPDDRAVRVDDGRAVDAPVDHGLHGVLDVVVRREGEHVGGHVRAHGRVAGHSVLRELGEGGGEPVGDVAGHQAAAPG